MSKEKDVWNLTHGVSGSDIVLSWNGQEAADGYLIWGSDYYNVFHILGEVGAEDTTYVWSAFDRRQINKVKVTAFVNAYGKQVTFLESNPIRISGYREEEMFLHTCKSYNGITLSWIDMDFADGYYVYQKKGEAWECICELSDYQVSFDSLNIGDCFIISAYRVKEGKKECFKFSKPYIYEMVETGGTGTSKVSVVMPCYNNEIFVARGIDSVLLSTFQDFELILVDDGSTDKTGEILDWYQREYPAIVKVIHKENGGVADARNAGIEVAGGEAICFPDSDDMIHPRMLELMYQDFSELGVDVVASQYYCFGKDKYLQYFLPVKEHCVLDVSEMLNRIYMRNYEFVGVWNKLYRTSLVKKKFFAKLMFDDTSWTPYILSYAKSMSFIKMPLYMWDRRVEEQKATATNVLVKMGAQDYVSNKLRALEFYVKNGNQRKQEILVCIAVTRMIQLYIFYNENNREIKKKIEEFHKRFNLLDNVMLQNRNEIYQKVKEVIG